MNIEQLAQKLGKTEDEVRALVGRSEPPPITLPHAETAEVVEAHVLHPPPRPAPQQETRLMELQVLAAALTWPVPAGLEPLQECFYRNAFRLVRQLCPSFHLDIPTEGDATDGNVSRDDSPNGRTRRRGRSAKRGGSKKARAAMGVSVAPTKGSVVTGNTVHSGVESDSGVDG